MVHSGPSPTWSYRVSVFVILKFNHTHLIYGPQASKQANTHTHVHNAVPLVWDLFRLAPIILVIYRQGIYIVGILA